MDSPLETVSGHATAFHAFTEANHTTGNNKTKNNATVYSRVAS